jgi:hypothetical protein
MMRFKEAFALREDYGHVTGYGVRFVDDLSGEELRLGVNFPKNGSLEAIAGCLGELARKCAEMGETEFRVLKGQAMDVVREGGER